MDHCSQPGLLPLADALIQLHNAITPVTEQEHVTLLDALDRVLAETIYSTIAVPSHDNAAMDGYALRHADITQHTSLRIIGQSLAGHAFNGTVDDGECVRIMTGAVVPVGADTVVMQENIQRTNDFLTSDSLNDNSFADDKITFITPPKLNENIRRAGEDIAQGTLVFSQGHRITPVDIGLLASLGITRIKVYRKLRIALLSTGDELTPPDQPLTQGHIYDSNRYALIALLQRLNIHCIDLGLVPDQPDAIADVFSKGVAEADAVISTGGVSVGDADYTKDVLTQMGTINFWKIAIKPGKPFAFGTLNKPDTPNKKETQHHNINSNNNSCWFFGLPGNPVSAVVTYHQLVLPALRQLAGEILQPSLALTAIASSNIKKQPGRTDFQRGILSNKNGINYVTTTGNQSSGVLSSIAQANCYIVLAQESGSITAGETVQVIVFNQFLK